MLKTWQHLKKVWIWWWSSYIRLIKGRQTANLKSFDINVAWLYCTNIQAAWLLLRLFTSVGMWQVQRSLPSGAAGKTSIKSRGNDAGDVPSTRDHTPVRSPAADETSYTATYESDSRVASAEVVAAKSGTIASALSNDSWIYCASLDILLIYMSNSNINSFDFTVNSFC